MNHKVDVFTSEYAWSISVFISTRKDWYVENKLSLDVYCFFSNTCYPKLLTVSSFVLSGTRFNSVQLRLLLIVQLRLLLTVALATQQVMFPDVQHWGRLLPHPLPPHPFSELLLLPKMSLASSSENKRLELRKLLHSKFWHYSRAFSSVRNYLLLGSFDGLEVLVIINFKKHKSADWWKCL